MAERRFRVRLDPTGLSPEGEPYIEWVAGPHPYIWIGDEEKGCYATCEPKKAERLARGILASEETSAGGKGG